MVLLLLAHLSLSVYLKEARMLVTTESYESTTSAALHIRDVSEEHADRNQTANTRHLPRAGAWWSRRLPPLATGAWMPSSPGVACLQGLVGGSTLHAPVPHPTAPSPTNPISAAWAAISRVSSVRTRGLPASSMARASPSISLRRSLSAPTSRM